MQKLILLIVLSFLGVACNNGGDSKSCSGANNCKDKPTGNYGNIKATVNFCRTVFFDQKLQRWTVIPAQEIRNGGFGAAVPVYSDFVNLTNEEVMNTIVLAEEQGNNPAMFSPSMHNKVPYLCIQTQGDDTYVYSFEKIDLAGNQVAGKTGSAIVRDGKAFVPFTNESFGGLFFPSEITQAQSAYTYRLRIFAQATSKKPSDIHTVNFNAALIIPNRDFNVNYSAPMRAMTMETRWQHFYKDNDGIANTDVELATLSEATNTPESIPLDLKVVFKTNPVIEVAYTIFNEVPLIIPDNYVTTRTGSLRGNAFYEKTYVLNSDRDFNFKFKINNTPITIPAGTREAELRDIPSGEIWRLTFGYDFTQKAAYPSGKQLLKPLKPVCNLIDGTPFYPIQELRSKQNYTNAGGYLSVCHPNDWKRYVIQATEINSTPHELVDSWFWSFSYTPERDTSVTGAKIAGMFNGVKQIEFRMSGCIKVLSREASPAPVNPNVWEVKNNDSPECSSGPGDTGWMRFSISRQVSIFDNTVQYSSTLGLKELVDLYRNSISKNTNPFEFEGDTFFEHLY